MDVSEIGEFYDKAVDTLIMLEKAPADTPKWNDLTDVQRAVIDQLLYEAGGRIVMDYMDEG